MFEKAGRKGWEAIVPFYSAYVMQELSGKPKWWVVLLFIPIINLIVGATIIIEFIKAYFG